MSTPAPGVAPASPVPPTDRRTKFLRRLALILVLAVFAAAFLVPFINISRYHRTIAETISRSLGRPVHLGSVQLQLLPHPGLSISDFIVEEDPRFGAEPLLRSPSVTVSLRFISLWRGRLEVSRIDLDDASLNLARDTAGQWNFASLLDQASHIPNAPTAQRHPSAAPRFPYIEFRNARINFKNGNEKKAFSFLNCDLSIWLDQPQQWRLRFEAQPARTDLDLDLADTGLIRVEGSLHRATSLDQMFVQLHAEWTGAPIGQVSRLTIGRDIGWRGDLRAEADIAGDVRSLRMRARLRVSDVHRQEFTPLTPFDIDATCQAAYRHDSRSLDDITCFWPIGSGHLLLTGEVRNLSRPQIRSQTRLTLAINHTPASFALDVLELLRPGLSSSIGADGLINGQFTWGESPRAAAAVKNLSVTATDSFSRAFSGQAVVSPLSLTLPGASNPIAFPPLHFATPSPAPVRGQHRAKHSPALPISADPPLLTLAAAPIAMGAPAPLELSGQFTRSAFDLRLSGPAALEQLLPWVQSFAVLRSSLSALEPSGNHPPGSADLDLTLRGPWLVTVTDTIPITGTASAPDSHPQFPTLAQGSLRIQHAQVTLPWLPAPLEIESATASFSPGNITPGSVIWSNATFSINGITAHGSATYPLACDDPAGCAAHLNLDLATLDAATLQSAVLGTGRHGELLDALLAQVEKRAPWPPVDGVAHIGSFALGPLSLHNARISLAVRNHALDIQSLDAATLGGTVHASGSIERTGSEPLYSLDLNFTGVNISEAAALFHEKWGTGSVDGGAKLTLQGYTASSLASSASGAFHWNWTQGSLPIPAPSATIEPASLTRGAASPLHFGRWIASGAIANGHLVLAPNTSPNTPANMSPSSITGSISFARELDLNWPAAKGAPLHIGGTLAHPTVEAAPNAPDSTPTP